MEKNLFKNIDEKVFQFVDKIKDKPPYQAFIDFYTGLDHQLQIFLQKSITFSVFAIPLLLILFFSAVNVKKKNELEVKEKIFTTSRDILTLKSKVSLLYEKNVFNELIDSKEQLWEKVRNIAVTLKIPVESLQINQFDRQAKTSHLKQISADLKFDNLTNAEIINLLENLKTGLRIKITDFELLRNPKDLFSGHMVFVFLGRNQ